MEICCHYLDLVWTSDWWTSDLLALIQWLFCLSWSAVDLSLSLSFTLSLSVCLCLFHSFCLHLSLYDFLTVCLPFFRLVFTTSVFVSFVGILLLLYLCLSLQSFSLSHSKEPHDVNVWWPAEAYDHSVFHSHKKHIKERDGEIWGKRHGNRKKGGGQNGEKRRENIFSENVLMLNKSK